MVAGPQTTVPLDDNCSRAVVQVHMIQEQKTSATFTPVLLIFIYTPEKAIQKYRHGEKVEEAHTKRGLNSHGEGGFEGLCLLEWRGVDRLVFIIILIVLVLVIIIPHIRHWSLHTRPAVVRVIRAGGHGAVRAAIAACRVTGSIC